MFKRMISFVVMFGCGGMATDYLPDGGVDGTHSAGLAKENDEEPSEVGDKWCIGCLAGVSVPQSIPMGYGLRPINETIGGRSLQFPACQGTQSSMPHACRTPTGNKVFFGNPPGWSQWWVDRYWEAVYQVGEELNNSGWTYRIAKNGPDPWDNADYKYKHTEITLKDAVSASPHPLFKTNLLGVQSTPSGNIKTYLACEAEIDWSGTLGVQRNGGHCSGECFWDMSEYTRAKYMVNVFSRALMRCAGIGGDQLPIYYHPAFTPVENCWAYDDWSCAAGGGDGVSRKEWFPDGWWSQSFPKSCQGNTPSPSCTGVFSGAPGTQFNSGSVLLMGYRH
jgi:hypothetical protein